MLFIVALLVFANFRSGRYTSVSEYIVEMLIMIPGVVLGMTFHEFGHALASHLLGDPTPKLEGRLSLNPAKHIDPFGLIFLLFVGFGWGKPVNVNSRNYKHPRRDIAIVSAAGVIMNLVLAIVLSFVLKIMLNVAPTDIASGTGVIYTIFDIVRVAVIVNLILMIFNLLPIPPLDGFMIITEIFNLTKYGWFYNVYRNGFWAMMVFIVLGASNYVVTPLVNLIWKLLVNGIIL